MLKLLVIFVLGYVFCLTITPRRSRIEHKRPAVLLHDNNGKECEIVQQSVQAAQTDLTYSCNGRQVMLTKLWRIVEIDRN